jgi:hypothetical protein
MIILYNCLLVYITIARTIIAINSMAISASDEKREGKIRLC